MFKYPRKNEDRAMEIHNEAFVFDIHSDTPCDLVKKRFLGEDHVLEKYYLENWEKGGLDGIVFSTMAQLNHYPTYFGNFTEGGLNYIDCTCREAEECPDHLSLCFETKDLVRSKADGRISIILGFEGAEPIGNNLANLRMFYRLGLRVLQLTWNQRNQVCDGIAEKSNAGLSNFGVDVVKECNELGIVIDISHISTQGFLDVMDLSKDPIIVSHTASYRVHNHPRNLTDEQIKMVAEKGGVVGIAFFPYFIKGRKPVLKDVCKHIEHMVDLVGTDHIALGPDFMDYCLDRMLPELQQVKLKEYSNPGSYPEGAEDVTKLPNITRSLVAMGYSDREIENILGENFINVLRKVIDK